MKLWLLILYLVNLCFTAKGIFISQSDKVVQSEDVEIKFLKNNCSMSCHLDKVKVKTIYVMKLLKQINGTFCDVLHIRRDAEIHKPHWFPCTNLRDRASHVGSSLDRMVLNISSDKILDSDNAIYKCSIEFNCKSFTGIYWNTAKINWTDCNDEQVKAESICTKPSLLVILLTFLYIMVV